MRNFSILLMITDEPALIVSYRSYGLVLLEQSFSDISKVHDDNWTLKDKIFCVNFPSCIFLLKYLLLRSNLTEWKDGVVLACKYAFLLKKV